MAFAFIGQRQYDKFLHGHALAAFAAEAQAKLLNDEQVGFIEIGPGKRFSGPASGVSALGGVSVMAGVLSSVDAEDGPGAARGMVGPGRFVTAWQRVYHATG